MPKTKVTISIDKAMSERVDALAQEQGVSRSRLHEMAIEAYLERIESELLTAEYAKFYGSYEPTDVDRAFQAASSRTIAEQLKDDQW